MRLNLAKIASFLDLPVPDRDPFITGVAIDSRKVRHGDLFVCLPGVRSDGHDHAGAAEAAGAGAILALRPLAGLGIPVLVVADTGKALGDLARCWRRATMARVICLTGTAGKTTLKDCLAAILAKAGKTACTEGNQNNQIGLPLTILNADGDEDFWLLEAGISRAGDMEYLGGIAEPDLAVILNAGPGHAEGLAGASVAWHKTRLLTRMAPDGIGLINADYSDLLAETRKLAIDFACFGSNACACAYRFLRRDRGSFTINIDGDPETFATPYATPYGWEIVTAAVGAASLLGLQPEQIRQGFANAALPSQRYTHVRTGKYLLVDDTYNANPLSMRRNLEAAKGEAAGLGLPFVPVLGEMAELGSEAASHHEQLGALLARLEPFAIFWKGAWLDEVSRGFRNNGGKCQIIALDSPQGFIRRWLQTQMPEEALVFCKGSRLNRLEDYAKAFTEEQGVL